MCGFGWRDTLLMVICFHPSEEGNLCFDVARMRVLMAVVENNLAMIFLFW